MMNINTMGLYNYNNYTIRSKSFYNSKNNPLFSNVSSKTSSGNPAVSFNDALFGNMGSIKSQAAALQSLSASMSSMSKYSSSIVKTAASSNNDVLAASVSRGAAVSQNVKTKINVTQLAQTQKNMGAELSSAGNSFGEKFEISITKGDGKKANFSVDIGGADNKEALSAMADKINGSTLGIKATLVEDKEKGTVSLALESKETGDKNGSFTVDDKSAAKLDNVTQSSKDAKYSVNGLNYTSPKNDVSLYGGGVKATLKSTGSAELTYKSDMSGAVGKVDDFIGAYNRLLDAAASSPALSAQMKSVSSAISKSLGSSGISADSNGKLSITDSDKLGHQIESGNFSKNFSGYGSIGSKIEGLSRNAYKTAYASASGSNSISSLYSFAQNNSTNYLSSMLSAMDGLIFSARV